MPTAQHHLKKVQEDLATAKLLMDAGQQHRCWCATTLFYVALHIVEAMLDLDSTSAASHFTSHSNRNALLRTTRSYEKVWRNYKELHQISLVARYLDNGYVDFDVYLSEADLKSRVIGHYLAQVGKACDRRVNGRLFQGNWDPKAALGI